MLHNRHLKPTSQEFDGALQVLVCLDGVTHSIWARRTFGEGQDGAILRLVLRVARIEEAESLREVVIWLWDVFDSTAKFVATGR